MLVLALLAGAGRSLLRESGTEPVVRVMVEAETIEQCQEQVALVVEKLCSQGHARV